MRGHCQTRGQAVGAVKAFFLVGYDYTEALLQLPEFASVRIGIRGADVPHFSENSLGKLQATFADRVIVGSAEDLLTEAASADADVVISLGWRMLIPAERRSGSTQWINVHPALLPRYRGYHPVPNVIINGEERHGVTAHLMVDEVDAGDIILQEAFDVSPFMTLQSLQYLVRELMPGFLRRLLNLLESGLQDNQPNPMTDDVIVAPRRTPSDSELQPEMSVADAYAQFRASDPERFPTYVTLFGEKVYISFSRAESSPRATPFDV